MHSARPEAEASPPGVHPFDLRQTEPRNHATRLHYTI